MKQIKHLITGIMITTTVLTACSNAAESTKDHKEITVEKVSKADWGEMDGKKVYLFTLNGKNGVQVKISNYGATVTSWITPDRNDVKSNIVLGFDSLSGYLSKPPYFGATIGRYGNRIAGGSFKIDTTLYTLAKNNGPNHLHGGIKGFDKSIWDATPATDGSASITMSYLSKDGEEGYPGNLKVNVKFTLTDDNELSIEYSAETDKTTVVNLTNHSYFNLSGDPTKTILGHSLQVNADKYTPVDKGLIPTGELKAVAGGPFDFLQPHLIGERIAAVEGGYDHNFVLARKSNAIELVATLSDTASGRKLEVYTTEPGLQFYSGNFLDGTFKTTDGKAIMKHAALCLETQHFPDSPNKPAFPTTLLKPGEKYHSTTTYKISLIK